MDLNDLLEDQSLELLDSAVIEGLRELGGADDPALVSELIEMFLEDAPKRLDDMLEGLSNGDYELMMRAAHTLKSSSANMGVMVLSHVCSRMEEAARDQNRGSYEGMVEACREAYSESERALRSVS